MTEPEYIRCLAREFRNPLVEVVLDDSGGVPKTLVERAVARKRDALRDAKRAKDLSLAFEEVWCVFDVDEHPRLGEAFQQARDNGIRVAVSNPCFELWMLLHFQDQRAFINREAAHSALKKHIRGYDKLPDFTQLSGGYNQAVVRAAQLLQHHESIGTPGGNPSSSVHLLSERIRKFGRDSRLGL